MNVSLPRPLGSGAWVRRGVESESRLRHWAMSQLRAHLTDDYALCPFCNRGKRFAYSAVNGGNEDRITFDF